MRSDIAIVIPSKNRLDWLKARILFHRNSNFTGILSIIDSSDQDHSKELLSFVNQTKAKNVEMFYRPGLGPHQAILFGLNQLPACIRYVCFSGDDDYHLPSGLDSAAKLLDDNSGAVTAAGQAFIGLSAFGHPPPQIKRLEKYWNRIQLDSSDSFERAVDHISHYHNWEFGLTRIEIYRRALELVLQYFGNRNFLQSRTSEYTFSLLLPAHGHVLWTNVPFLLRVDHPSRPNRLDKSIRSKANITLLAKETLEVFKSAGINTDCVQIQILHKYIRLSTNKSISIHKSNAGNPFQFLVNLVHKIHWHITGFVRAKRNSQWLRLIQEM